MIYKKSKKRHQESENKAIGSIFGGGVFTLGKFLKEKDAHNQYLHPI